MSDLNTQHDYRAVARPRLAAEGLRLAHPDEPGWLWQDEEGRKLWVTGAPTVMEAFGIEHPPTITYYE